MPFFDKITNDIDAAHISEAMICSPENLNTHFDFSRKALTIFHTNVRSVACNFDSLLVLLERLCFQCDLIILTECWLSKSPILPVIAGYTAYASNSANQNDGVLLYIKSEIKHNVMIPSISGASGIVLKLENQYAVVAMYRSPSCRDISTFCDSLDTCLKSLNSVQSLALIGDININISPLSNDSNSGIYLDLMAHYGLLPAHVIPTRGDNCLDHVMLRTNSCAATYILDSFITDHAPLVFCLYCKIKRHTPNTTVLKIDYPALIHNFTHTDFGPVYNSSDPNVAANNLINTISDVISANSKLINIPHRKRTIKPWMTPGLIRCVRHRDKLHKKTKLDPNNAILLVTYTRYRNFCNNLLKKLRISFEKSEFHKYKNNPRGMWQTINTITNLRQSSPPPCELLNLATDPCESLNQVNRFFSEIGSTYANAILNNQVSNPSHISHECILDTQPKHSMALFDTDWREVDNIITHLKNDSAAGIDNIPTRVIKSAKNSLIPPLTYLYNLCLNSGVFPDILKGALVHPIYKSGDRDSVGNYRPISVLSVVSKILEKLINYRLVQFLDKYNLIADNQFGFIKGKSTEDATLLLTETISKHLDKNEKVIGVFLDLSKAFDTVSVPILLSKMESIGIRGVVLDLFRSYLSDRTQCVRLGNFTSSKQKLSFGVPQGSVLGPTLFLLYINTLCTKSLPNCSIITYADDTALVVHGRDWTEARIHTEHAIREVLIWLNCNLLTLNIDKTRYVTFTLRTNTQPPPDFKVTAHTCKSQTVCGCPQLNRSPNIKYLGLLIDCSLSWLQHIKLLTTRIRRLIPVFRKLRASAEYVTLLCVYHALAQCLLQYCVTVWGGVGRTALLPLERAQRAILKVMLGKPRRYSTELLYGECSVLTVRQLFILSTLLRKHKSHTYKVLTKRNKTKVCSVTPHRTNLASNQFYVRSNKLYNVANKINNIYPLPTSKCKDILRKWLLGLNYIQAEDLLNS